MSNPRISVWILGDQLLRDHPALRHAQTLTDRDNIRVVMVESQSRTRQLPDQRKKLVLLFSAMRHYAEHLRAEGYEVDYVQAATFLDGLRAHLEEDQPVQMVTMAASEYDLRLFQNDQLADALGIPVSVVPNTQFLVGQHDPNPAPAPDKRYVLETFYRDMRRHFDVLMDGDQPMGGEWNYDKENRKPLPTDEKLPRAVSFKRDIITREVIEQINAAQHGVGTVRGFNLAVTHAEAEQALNDFITYRLARFGPYEDAMATRSGTLFHSALSPYLNIGLLEPMQVIRAAEAAFREGKAPINSVEGFVRQVLGWREFIYWQYWQQMPDLRTANSWNATRPMPGLFWDGQTDMNCVRHVVERATGDGYTHHIERLMIVCNFCMLAGINPQAVNDWFLSFYIDAYEWVMLPNVIGMGLNADGGRTATKPYIASANYIHKMSDYCKGCRFKQNQRTGEDACPFNFLYWNFLIEHEAFLRANGRMGPNVLGLRHLDEAERQRVREQARQFLDALPGADS